MKRKKELSRRLALLATAVALVAGAVWGLALVNETMTIRYQAAGIVTDVDGNPLDGVEVLLTLEPPPPPGPRLDALFEAEGVRHGRQAPDGRLVRGVGPTVGLSGATGAYLVRAMGRAGAAQAIRLGLDSDRPPFEVAWVLFRKPGYADLTRTVSVMGWRKAPSDWGTFANRLPMVAMQKETP